MLVESYPFIRIRSGDVARPYLPITIINPDNNKKLNVFALIDTGADECALPASFAQPLKHNLQAGYHKKISTGNGITIAYSHAVCIKAGLPQNPWVRLAGIHHGDTEKKRLP